MFHQNLLIYLLVIGPKSEGWSHEKFYCRPGDKTVGLDLEGQSFLGRNSCWVSGNTHWSWKLGQNNERRAIMREMSMGSTGNMGRVEKAAAGDFVDLGMILGDLIWRNGENVDFL